MKKFLIVFILILFILLPTNNALLEGDAESTTNFDVTLYSSNNGIPTSEANTVIETEEGYIYIGGYSGLYRYDGYTFEYLSGKNGLTSYSIRSLFESKDHTFYIGSNDQGVFFLKDSKFYKINSMNKDKHLSIRALIEDDYGRIWIASSDGIAYIENEILYSFDLVNYGYQNLTTYTLSIDDSGILSAVDYNGAILMIDTNSMVLKKVLSPGEIWDSGIYAYSHVVSKDGTIYVGTNTNKIIILTKNGDTYNSSIIDSKKLKSINAVYEKNNGEIWFGGDYGLGYIDNNGLFHDESNLDYTSRIVNLCEDYEHNIWAASSKYGVLHIRQVKVSRLKEKEILENKETYAIESYYGNYYLGAEDGLYIFDSNMNEVNNELSEELKGIQVHSIKESNDHKLLIGTFYYGLYIYDHDSNTFSNITTTGNKIRMIDVLKNGNIAVATNRGVDILNGSSIIETINTSITVLCLEELDDGTLLLGTDGHCIYRYKYKELENYILDGKDSIGGVILRMVKDQKDSEKIFVSTGNDIYYGSDRGFIKLNNIKYGSGSILDIFIDGEYIWLFRSSGIVKVKRDELINNQIENSSIEYFSIKDGIPGPIVANSWSLFKDGSFFICTSNGIGKLDANNVYKNSEKPKLAISNIKFSDGSIWDGSKIVYLNNKLTKVTFYLSALTFSDDQGIIKYYMEGVDENPIERSISEFHEVEYTNLSKGTYKFHYSIKNSDGIESDEIIITLIKAPKFIETIWFVLTIIASTALVISLVFILRVQTIKKKQQEYKEITDQTIATISGAIDAKDPYTEGHSRRVAEFAIKLGKKIGLEKDELERLHYIALLHDIGKIGVPDEILNKPGKLSSEEFEIIKKHTTVGGDILKNLTMLDGVAEGAMYHHERYDGSGYCAHLKGEEIPLFARIISVADAYDAMNSSRCYRKALDKETIKNELIKGKGIQFDPKLVEVALELMNEE